MNVKIARSQGKNQGENKFTMFNRAEYITEYLDCSILSIFKRHLRKTNRERETSSESETLIFFYLK